jgi:hypothetical protein
MVDIYVDGVAGTDGVECGTKEWPCASLNAALVLKATQDDVVIVSGPLSGMVILYPIPCPMCSLRGVSFVSNIPPFFRLSLGPLNSGFDIRGPRKLTIKSHPALTSPVVVTCNAGLCVLSFVRAAFFGARSHSFFVVAL